MQTLKPDLRVVIGLEDYELHWFVEADLATEHLPVIRRQCAAYEQFRATGRYQAEHGLFPTVLWVAPDEVRAAALRAAVASPKGSNQSDLFQACATEEYAAVITGGAANVPSRSNEVGGQEGGDSS